MGARDYISGLALLAALATTSGCNGLERRALADTSSVQGAPAAAAPSNLAAGETSATSGSSDSEKPHPNGFFYDSQGRKVPPTPESIKAYEATLKTPDDELYRLIDSLDAKKAEEENQKGNYEFALGMKDVLDRIRQYNFKRVDDDRKKLAELGFNNFGYSASKLKRTDLYDLALEFLDEAIRINSSDADPWINAASILIRSERTYDALPYVRGFLDRKDPNTEDYKKVKIWYDKQQ